MRCRTPPLIVVGIALGLLAPGVSYAALALTQSRWLGNSGHGSRMAKSSGQPFPGTTMGGYQPGTVQQETPVIGTSRLTMTIVMKQPGMPTDWPAFAPSNLVVPANSLVTITLRDADLGTTALPQTSPFTTVQGTVNAISTVDGREYSSLAPDKIAHTFTLLQLHVNVPLPGDGTPGKNYHTVTFTFRTGAPGTYLFRCVDPCGAGPMGMMGPMMTQGYMIGTLTVQEPELKGATDGFPNTLTVWLRRHRSAVF